MADAVVLYDGTIIKLSAISNSSTFDPNNDSIMFFSDGEKKGTVKRFTIGPNSYMATFKPNNKEFSGYFIEKNFWNANVIKSNTSKTNSAEIKNLGEKFTPPAFSMATENDFVCMAFEKVYFHPENNSLNRVVFYKKTIKKQINFSAGFNINSIIDTQHQTSKIIKNELQSYYNNIVARQYLDSNVKLYPLGEPQKDILFDIISILDTIYKDANLMNKIIGWNFESVLNYHISLPTRYTVNTNGINLSYHNTYNEEFFARIRLGLIDFMYFVKSYGPTYNKLSSDDLSVCIVNIFPPVELARLPYPQKINLLNRVVLRNNWIQGNWYFNLINHEQAIIKIIRSIACETNGTLNYTEIDSFMDYLSSRDYSTKESKYEVLYSKINDGIFGDDSGKGNKGQFVNAVYNLWLESKFNPNHSVTTVANAAAEMFKYPTEPAYKNINTNGIDENSAPLVLNYESEKILVWYTDNFKFKFNKRKIEAYQETYVDYGKYAVTAGSFANTGNYYNSQYILYGTYELFQPVVLKASKLEDTIIKMPIKGLPQNANPKDYINNSIPIFYLKYIDDSGDYSDAKETIGLLIDVALTFSGVGNIAKLKHFRYLSKFGRLNTLAPETRILYFEAVSGVSAAFEITAGVTSSMLSYMENQRTADPEYYDKLDYLMFALELLSLSFDALAQRAVRKRAKEVLDHKLNNGGWPSVLDDETKKAKEVIEKLALYDEIIIDAINKLPANVKAKVDLFDQDKQIAFLSDFAGNKDNILNTLNNANNAFYFDNWEKLYAINCIDRKQIDFISKTILTDCLIRYYSDVGLRKVLELTSLELRIKFLKKYGTTDRLDVTTFNKLTQNPSKLEMLLNNVNGTKNLQPDEFITSEVFNIINSNLDGLHVDLLGIKSRYSLDELGKRFSKQIKYNVVSKERLKKLYDAHPDIYPTFGNLLSSNRKRKAFQGANQLLVGIQPYNGNNPAGSLINERYVSGLNSSVTRLLGNPPGHGFIEPSNQSKFDIFKIKAIDLDKGPRDNDTELKFIFNFLEQHWNKGDRFVINMESKIQICSSCQGYITSLQELAKQNDKIIEFNITAHPEAEGIVDVIDLIK